MTQSLEKDNEEAALWVARHMEKVVDVTAFSQWLAGAPGRREKFDALWATCMDDAVTEGLRRYQRREDEAAGPTAARAPFPTRRIAISALVAASVAALALSWPQIHFAFMPAQDYATAPGEVRSFTLADGSTVMLNGASRIAAKIGNGRREVTLENGEALFDVRHDTDRPFTVAAGDGRVAVLGTRFDLALNGGTVDLSVERGLVRFASSADSKSGVLVPAAHSATLAEGHIGPPLEGRAALTAAWQDGWLEVTDMPLAQVLPRLQRWTGKTIVADDPGLLQKRVAGRFRLSDPAAVLGTLGELYGFRVEDAGQSYRLVAQ